LSSVYQAIEFIELPNLHAILLKNFHLMISLAFYMTTFESTTVLFIDIVSLFCYCTYYVQSN